MLGPVFREEEEHQVPDSGGWRWCFFWGAALGSKLLGLWSLVLAFGSWIDDPLIMKDCGVGPLILSVAAGFFLVISSSTLMLFRLLMARWSFPRHRLRLLMAMMGVAAAAAFVLALFGAHYSLSPRSPLKNAGCSESVGVVVHLLAAATLSIWLIMTVLMCRWCGSRFNGWADASGEELESFRCSSPSFSSS